MNISDSANNMRILSRKKRDTVEIVHTNANVCTRTFTLTHLDMLSLTLPEHWYNRTKSIAEEE